ncbi:MAG: MAPEG family protein [Alphaproteobacteria bacterium]|nr:MAPEG family protein [Alphaproteobacteria bacterium]
MSLKAVLLPLFVQVGLSFALLLWLASVRRILLKSLKVKWQDIALKQKPWPDQALQISNCLQNQFEIPILFYVLISLSVSTQKASLTFVILEWLFVATRLAHAYIFTTSNYVPLRGQFFIAGVLILLGLWVIYGYQILVSP